MEENDFILNKVLFDEISHHFEILEVIDSTNHDLNFEQLDEKIKSFKDFSFGAKQRILFYYQDLSFYQNLVNGPSVFLYNLYQILKKYNIPPEFVILITNHYGINKEIEQLNLSMQYSLTKIIETSLWYDFPIIEKIHEKNVTSINSRKEFLFTCLNNMERIHRNYTLCCLKENNLINNGIVSYRFKNEHN